MALEQRKCNSRDWEECPASLFTLFTTSTAETGHLKTSSACLPVRDPHPQQNVRSYVETQTSCFNDLVRCRILTDLNHEMAQHKMSVVHNGLCPARVESPCDTLWRVFVPESRLEYVRAFSKVYRKRKAVIPAYFSQCRCSSSIHIFISSLLSYCVVTSCISILFYTTLPRHHVKRGCRQASA